MGKKPYANSTADPMMAQKRIRKMLQKFGVSRVAFDEDFENTVLAVMFKYSDYPIRLPVNYGDLAEVYLDEAPYSYRMKCTKDEYIEKKRDIAYRATYSLIENFLKSLIMIVEMEIFSFEEIFISYITDNQGRRLGEIFVKNLPELVGGNLALKE